MPPKKPETPQPEQSGWEKIKDKKVLTTSVSRTLDRIFEQPLGPRTNIDQCLATPNQQNWGMALQEISLLSNDVVGRMEQVSLSEYALDWVSLGKPIPLNTDSSINLDEVKKYLDIQRTRGNQQMETEVQKNEREIQEFLARKKAAKTEPGRLARLFSDMLGNTIKQRGATIKGWESGFNSVFKTLSPASIQNLHEFAATADSIPLQLQAIQHVLGGVGEGTIQLEEGVNVNHKVIDLTQFGFVETVPE